MAQQRAATQQGGTEQHHRREPDRCLKPYGADDGAIRRQLRFTGTPPVYIPMPPH
jgi:macrolide transport system ATP-binding/permease protein/lipoprotein-releasing system ATP-binding protein